MDGQMDEGHIWKYFTLEIKHNESKQEIQLTSSLGAQKEEQDSGLLSGT